MLSFEVTASCAGSAARVGRLTTPHGAFDTPAFMPVGTRGSVKGVTPDQVAETGAQIILANTYHLALRPGAETVAALGGLQTFMGWDGPILTDSGGFQVFSLPDLVKIDEDGVDFRSHVDGSPLRLDPARAMQIQEQLGADIIMALDQCIMLPAPREQIVAACERTVRWAAACKAAHARRDQWLFGIVQGGTDEALRADCAARLIDIDFPGYAIGGLSVGESPASRAAVTQFTAALLPAAKPRYLMGVGTPRDLFAAAIAGVDMFDCVLPTRNGRNAWAFAREAPLRLRNERFRDDREPIEADCDCLACRRFSRGYLRHLFLADEMLGPILVSIHNLRFLQRFMVRLRELIPTGNWDQILAEFPIARDEATTEETS